jgi:hypothetical protein
MVAFGAWLMACPANYNASSCATACSQLQACGFLPSSLGTSLTGVSEVDNCAGRCEESTDDVVKAVYECAVGADAGDDASSPPCGTGCASLANCLIRRFPQDDVTGQAGVSVIPVLAIQDSGDQDGADDGGTGTCGPPPCEAAVCPTAAGTEFLGNLPAAWCRSEFAQTGRAFVFQTGAYTFSDTTGCPDLLTHSRTFTSLDPGPVLVGVEVRGTVTSIDDGGADSEAPSAEGGAGNAKEAGAVPFCHQYYGDRIALLSGQIQTALVPLRDDAGGQVLDCEEGTTLCHDNYDNDLNGLFDCSDPRCGPVCLDAGAPSEDGSAVVTDAGVEAAALDSGMDGR